MRRIYMTLLPIYKEEEMRKEIEEEWIMDSASQNALTLHLFTKLLFRIAHQWATNIDLAEYVELLEKIFQRITMRKVIKASTGEAILCYPTIQVEIIPETGSFDGEDPFGLAALKTENALIEPCQSDDEDETNYDYVYIEDPETLTVTKNRRRKLMSIDHEGNDERGDAPFFSFKEAIQYKENVVFHQNSGDYRPTQDDFVSFVLADMRCVVPFGYPTEQFLTWIKNDVQSRLEEARLARKEQLAKMKREVLENGGAVKETQLRKEQDDGIVKANQFVIYVPFDIKTGSNEKKYIRGNARVVDILYNSLRQSLKDIAQYSLRLFMATYKREARSAGQKRASITGNEPTTEINSSGFNPAFQRKVIYQQAPMFSQQGKTMSVNINYLYQLQDYETAYRCDVERVENSNKLAIKPNENLFASKDFVPVTSSYKKTRELMLTKKFSALYADSLGQDVDGPKRVEKVFEKEVQRKKMVSSSEPLNTKGVGETYDDKSLIKIIKGPFYKFISRQGIIEDNFVDCAQKDLIEVANTESPKIFIFGKPRSGKTTLSRLLSQKFKLMHINVENWLAKLIEKIKNHDPEEDQVEEGEQPKKWLTDLEERVYKTLQEGKGPSQDQIISILKNQTQSPEAKTNGFILDLHYYPKEGEMSWTKIIRVKELLGIPSKNGDVPDFSHIIELDCDDNEVKLRAKNMLLDPTDGVVYSKWEIEERNKPKPKKFDEDGNVIEEEEDENAPKKLLVENMAQRVSDYEEFFLKELAHYNQVERPAIDDLIIKLYNNQYSKLDCSGLTPTQLFEAAECRIQPNQYAPLRPLPKQLEGAGDFKACLTDALEELPEGQDPSPIPRQWSLWQQQDPVALFNGKVLKGSSEFAVAFANNMFVFANEENMKEFISQPKKYLKKAPEMPKHFRLLMLGPRGIGVHTQAKKLNQRYGWKVIDYQELVKRRIKKILSEKKLPNNVIPQLSAVGLSQQEVDEIKLGKPFPSWKFIPWVLDELGFKLMKRPPPPQAEEPNLDDLTDEQKAQMEKEKKKKAAEEAKRQKEEEEAKKAKEERRKKREDARERGLDLHEMGLDESEEEIKVDDLSIDDLVLATGKDNKIPFVGGFILLGFPQTELHAQKLKDHGIQFDKIVLMSDKSEESPGQKVKERMVKVDIHYNYEAEVERVGKLLEVANATFGGEENPHIEIDANGTVDDIFIKIQKEIDPFITRVDNPDDIITFDPESEEKKPLKSDFGDFCPVTFVNQGWLVKGNPEFQKSVFGKTYLFAGEAEAAQFEFNPMRFMISVTGQATLPLQPPPPRIMVVGMKGSGITTQLNLLSQKYKLQTMVLKEKFLQKMEEEKNERKRLRLLNRGFRPLPPAEEGEEPPKDEEIENDPDDFDKEQQERQLIKAVFNEYQGVFIDGTWNNFPEETVQALDGAGYANLLFESRRLPEAVVILRCKEQSSFSRLIDSKALDARFNELVAARDKRMKEERENDRKEAVMAALLELIPEEEKKEDDAQQPPEVLLKKLTDELANDFNNKMKEWDENRDTEDEAKKEDDPEKPDREAMENEHREKITTQREADEAFLEEFKTALEEKGVKIIDSIKTDVSPDFVFVKIVDLLKDHIQFRRDLIERSQALPLTSKELSFYENSFTYRASKFGLNSPISLSNSTKTRQHAVQYRERIYYLSDSDEQLQFLKEPSKFTNGLESIPLDVNYKPSVCVLGYPRAGKTTLCERINQRTGAIHIQMDQVIQMYIGQDSAQCERLRQQMMLEGRATDDTTLVSLLMKRIQAPDCQKYGFVIEDFPKTKHQAQLISRQGLKLSNVILVDIPLEEVYTRTHHDRNSEFSSNRIILSKRLRQLNIHLPQVTTFFQSIFNSLTVVDGTKSKWYMEDTAIKQIEANIAARQSFARDLCFQRVGAKERPCLMENLNIDLSLLKASLSQFGYYCPVSWRNTKQFVNCVQLPQFCVFYQNVFYYFKGAFERQLFLQNPERFIQNVYFSSQKGIPKRLKPHKAVENDIEEKALLGYCSVSLVEENRVVRGDKCLIVNYKDSAKFAFETEQKLQKFLTNPFKYAKVELPVKMPTNEDQISLYNLQGNEESTTFMEQALGSIVTKGLREVSENRMKYPNVSVKETMLKLFAIFLKAENPANTEFMKEKYRGKMRKFIKSCEVAEELNELTNERNKKMSDNKWAEFKEKYYLEVGAKFDQVYKESLKDKETGFSNFLK